MEPGSCRAESPRPKAASKDPTSSFHKGRGGVLQGPGLPQALTREQPVQQVEGFAGGLDGDKGGKLGKRVLTSSRCQNEPELRNNLFY